MLSYQNIHCIQTRTLISHFHLKTQAGVVLEGLQLAGNDLGDNGVMALGDMLRWVVGAVGWWLTRLVEMVERKI